MIKTGLQNEAKITELLVSGSTSIKTKNEYGVHVFSGSIADDGIISGKLTKPKYNNAEVIKSIDTNIVELIAPKLPPVTPTVLKSTFDAAQATIRDLTNQVESLNKNILDLSGKVSELHTVTESLKIEMDSKDILLAISQNQTQQSTSRVQGSVVDLQNSIQRATAESIQRVSLFARNDVLDKQILALNDQLTNAQGQIINLNNTVNQLNIQLNTAASQANAAQTQAAASQQAQLATTKKKKIICNELYLQGYLPQHIWNADEVYGEMMYEKDPRLVLGYMMWARNVVKYMKAKPQNTKWIYRMVKPWTEHMAYEVGTLPKDNWIGKLIHNIGKQYCYYVYDKQMSKRNKLSWQ